MEVLMPMGEKLRRMRLMGRRTVEAMYILAQDGPITDENFVRAGCNAECKVCGLENIEHPEITELGLHINCSGELLKL